MPISCILFKFSAKFHCFYDIDKHIRAVRIRSLSLFLCLHFLSCSVFSKFVAYMSNVGFWYVYANAVSLYVNWIKIYVTPFCIELYRARKGPGSFLSKDLKLMVGNPKNCEKELV